MKCSQLLEHLEYTCLQGSTDVKVTAVVNDSRKIEEGCLFLCIKGAAFDGHKFAAEAAEKGAAVLVVEDEVEVPDSVTVIKVDNTRYAMALISAAWFGYPAEELTTIAVTGTKGKTTTTYMVKSLLEEAGHKVGVIGTIEVVIGQEHIPVNNTTPESYDIHSYFRKMAEEDCDVVVMEASSQGFKLDRTAGIMFDYGLFTNLSPDHIGPNEHGSFEEYAHCKSLLFQQCRVGIANVDDVHWQLVTKEHTCSLETYGMSEKADLRAQNLQFTNRQGHLGIAFDVTGLMNFHAEIAMPGRFSVYNALTAIAICRHFKVSEADICKALLAARVKGRIEMVKVSNEFTLMIDYAHNAMALKSLLTTLKEYEHGRLVCVFGCGGNRSRERRFEMGEVSGNLADFTIITSDNPRFEEPEAIIEDIITGMKKTDGVYISIPDRKEAIAYAIDHGQPGDIIVLAGKGHEDYQEIKGVKYPMDERDLIADILKERGISF